MAGFFTISCQSKVGHFIVQPLSAPLTEGKWYWEICIPYAGMASSRVIRTVRTGVLTNKDDISSNLGDAAGSYAWRADGTSWRAGEAQRHSHRLSGKYGIITVALDLDRYRIWFGANGKWFNGSPETGTSETFTLSDEAFIPAVSSVCGGIGSVQAFIPSNKELLAFSPPSGFSPLEPGFKEPLPPPFFSNPPHSVRPDETTVPNVPERILAKLGRGVTWGIWKADGLWNRLTTSQRILTPPILRADHPGHRVCPAPTRAPVFDPSTSSNNPPNIPIEEMINDSSARHKYYLDFSDNMLAKGNFYMASKLIRQAEACSPLQTSIQDRIHWLGTLGSVGFQFDPSLRLDPNTEKPGNDHLFDFVFIPTEKCGSTAHLTMLSAHPGSTVPTNAETQSAFFHDNESSLLQHFKRHASLGGAVVRTGLVMDARISGARQQPSGIVTGTEFAKRLSEIVHPDGFFQAIRHPFGMVKSTYNSNILLYDLGGYSFSFTNPNTLFGGGTIDVETFELRPAHFEHQGKSPPKIDRRTLRDRLDFAVRVPRPYSVGKSHAGFFDSWNLIDLDRRQLSKGSSRMAESYNALGLDPNFTHPLEKIPYRDKTHFTMQRNHLHIRVFGAEMRITMGRALQTISTNDDNMLELAWSHPSDEARAVGLNNPVCLAADKNDWISLPPELKQRIIESGILQKFLVDTLMPLWVHDYTIWLDAISPNLIHEFEPQTVDKIISCSGHEFTNFLNQHPSVADSWPDLTQAL